MQVGLTIGYGNDVQLLFAEAVMYGLSANDPGVSSPNQAIYLYACGTYGPQLSVHAI